MSAAARPPEGGAPPTEASPRVSCRPWRSRLGWGIEIAGLAVLLHQAWRIG